MRKITSFSARGTTYPLSNVQVYQNNFGTLVPKPRHMIGKDGGFDEGGAIPALAEIGTIQAEIVLEVIRGNLTDMTAKLNQLMKLSREIKGFLYATMEDASVRWCIARSDGISAPQTEDGQTGILLRAQIDFQVSDPHWYEQGTEAPAWGYFNWGGASWGGTAVPHVIAGTATEFTETVGGGTIKTQSRLRISCDVGQTAQNIKVQRLKDGLVVDEVLYTGTLVAGDVLDINPRRASVLLNGVDRFDNLTWLNPKWFELEPGNNEIRVQMANSGDAANLALNYLYKYV